MAYCLLTGATGLVGHYLLRYLIGRDVPVAVLVRSTRLASAGQRVDGVMRRWEELAGHSMARPVVLEGDLRKPNLGLDSAAQKWITDNCQSMLHNAASMTFREDKSSGEPFRTNVDGVRNVLQLCRDTGIRHFHHVSTAYVCGLRQGLVRESELDVGQQNGNVYEKSKLLGEQMVLGADCFDQTTIYRPASVVGDSQTGFTTSTHGFYLPLQMAHAMADKVPVNLMGERFFKLLGLAGNEGKNLVPVDWLAQAIVHVFTHAEHHGRTYHLTSPHPVTVRLIQKTIQEAIERHAERRTVATLSEEVIVGYENLFRHYMDIYRSHWRDDPKFDRTNSDRALADLPCPELDHEAMLRIASYPVKKNFALHELAPPRSTPNARLQLETLVEAGRQLPAVSADDATVGLQINGEGGGQWRLHLRGGSLVGAELGMNSQEMPRYYLNAMTFTSLVQGQITAEESVGSGRVVVEGTDRDPDSPTAVLRQIVSAIRPESHSSGTR